MWDAGDYSEGSPLTGGQKRHTERRADVAETATSERRGVDFQVFSREWRWQPGCTPLRTTMLRLTQSRRAVLAAALREVAALIIGALALGWYVGDAQGSAVIPLVGVVAWAVSVGLAMAVTDGKSSR
jgi:hypothetical protein